VRAWEAFHAMQQRPASDRADLLDAIASHITALGDGLLSTTEGETGLHHMRLLAERDRTTTTLAMFADAVREGSWVGATIDTSDATRKPVPKPDLRRMLRPLGPVAVFGAGNFPLAYSTAGGDTASALAAGCPVIVKGHPSHPATGEAVAHAVAQAVRELRFHPGTFSFLHAGGTRTNAIGQRLIQHGCIRAVGFTGSVGGGLALAQIAGDRPDPIPVFSEMGSVNPVFVLPHALKQQLRSIVDKLYASATNAAGQMCTCPGLIMMIRSDEAEDLVRALADKFNDADPMVMLSPKMRSNYLARVREITQADGVELRGGSPQSAMGSDGPVRAAPVVFRTSFETFRRSPTLHEECFGPSTIVVMCDDEQQLASAAAAVQGSLTGSIFAGGYDAALANQIQIILEQRVGRLIFNGVPTGVEPCASMVHGGPFPATNQPHTTAVGRYAIERWCRPVCYQNAPEAMLPDELRSDNPRRVLRLVDGKWTRDTLGPR